MEVVVGAMADEGLVKARIGANTGDRIAAGLAGNHRFQRRLEQSQRRWARQGEDNRAQFRDDPIFTQLDHLLFGRKYSELPFCGAMVTMPRSCSSASASHTDVRTPSLAADLRQLAAERQLGVDDRPPQAIWPAVAVRERGRSTVRSTSPSVKHIKDRLVCSIEVDV